MTYAFRPDDRPAIPIAGSDDLFPVHRIYCIGRNYAEHAKEMDALNIQPSTDDPIFFSKPADAIVPEGGPVSYPGMTENLQHEVELVAAIGRAGRDVSQDSAPDHIMGYAVGCDLTRRDLQAAAKTSGSPWDTAKGFDQSAPISAISLSQTIGHPSAGRIWLDVNNATRQQADLSDMLWSTAQIVSLLSRFYQLRPGDLVFTGTPAGVSPINRGDRIDAGIETVGTLSFTLV